MNTPGAAAPTQVLEIGNTAKAMCSDLKCPGK